MYGLIGGLHNKLLIIHREQPYPFICLCTEDPGGESEGYTGGLPTTTGSASSRGSGYVDPSSDSENSKFKEFSRLREEKSEIVDEIEYNKNILKNIQLAEKLDSKLPEIAKNQNSYLKDIKEEFSSFFDEESNYSSVQDSLNDIKQYVNGEQGSLKSKLARINTQIKDLTHDSTEDNPESSKNPFKDDGFESDAQPPAKKRSRSDDGDDNNRSDPSSPSTPYQGGDTYSCKTAEGNYSDYSHVQ